MNIVDSFFPPFPSTTSFVSDHSQTLQRYTRLEEGISALETTQKPLKYGTKISTILNSYKFSTNEFANKFFSSFLSARNPSKFNEAMISDFVRRTINIEDTGSIGSKIAVDISFHRSLEKLLSIEPSSSFRSASIQIILGSTGAGKTFFSKSLFTVCLSELWEKNIVPCRIEYSKAKAALRDKNDRIKIFDHIKWCMFRDVVNYIFFSGNVDDAKFDLLYGALSIVPRAAESLLSIYADIGLQQPQLDNLRFSTERRLMLNNKWGHLERPEIENALIQISKLLSVRYLISIDGFDCIHIEDFIFGVDGFEAEKVPAITYIMDIVKEVHLREDLTIGFSRNFSVDFIVYMRDTTFNQFSLDWKKKVGGPLPFKIHWIVPPSYLFLTGVALKYIQNPKQEIQKHKEYETNTCEEGPLDSFAATDGTIASKSTPVYSSERLIALEAQITNSFSSILVEKQFDDVPIELVFGSNARMMLLHIKNVLMSASIGALKDKNLSHLMHDNISLRRLVSIVIDNNVISTLPRYILLENLFLHHTRQLIPRFNIRFKTFTQAVNKGDRSSALDCIKDREETSSIVGCIFNYFYAAKISSPDSEVAQEPAMLILIRILQYIDKHNSCYIGEVIIFLNSIGYAYPEAAIEFLIYVLIRAELVKWDPTTEANSIENAPLYITPRANILLSQILRSVTYLSESIITALHFSRQISDFLKSRNADSGIWVADCISNSLVALDYIRRIELIECANAKEHLIEFEEYRLYSILKHGIANELRYVRRTSVTAANWSINRAKLESLKKIIGEEFYLPD